MMAVFFYSITVRITGLQVKCILYSYAPDQCQCNRYSYLYHLNIVSVANYEVYLSLGIYR